MSIFYQARIFGNEGFTCVSELIKVDALGSLPVLVNYYANISSGA